MASVIVILPSVFDGATCRRMGINVQSVVSQVNVQVGCVGSDRIETDEMKGIGGFPRLGLSKLKPKEIPDAGLWPAWSCYPKRQGGVADVAQRRVSKDGQRVRAVHASFETPCCARLSVGR
jgi:hypothetical protein